MADITPTPYEETFRLEESPRGGWQIVSLWGMPVGAAFDFYSEATKLPMQVSRNPFPKILSTGLTGDKPKHTRKEIEAIFVKFKKHVRAVIDNVPSSQKVGSSKFWKP